jgi:protein-S-isoprenylcysteine O-methyltransferase Ste14
MQPRADGKAVRSLHPGAAFLVCILTGILLDRVLAFPGSPWPFAVRLGAGAPALTLALLLAAWGFFTLRSAGTPIEPGKIPVCLVVVGPYRITRNPLYLAQLLFLGGLGFLAFPWLLPLAVLQGILLDRLVIRGEEQRLAEAFGDPFDQYRARVRRWL